MSEGILYVAYGPAAQREAAASIASLKKHHDYPVHVIEGEAAKGDGIRLSRAAKLNLNQITPFRHTLYLDADTRIVGDLSTGFRILADGWDLVIAPSGRQGYDVMGHLPKEERDCTIDALLNPLPLQWQAGVFYFDRERTRELFAAWRQEWARFEGQDQGALLRALSVTPVRVWGLGGVWNRQGGEVVDHLFGRARLRR
jgi:hypothetical protein